MAVNDLATVETDAKVPASEDQLAEMQKLLAAVAEGGTAELAQATSKRTWLKRGIAAIVQSGEMIDQCPESERPFFEFFDTIHKTMRERMLALGENRSRGDYRVYQSDLERLWRDEYGKWEGAGGGGMTVVIVERPPRDG